MFNRGGSLMEQLLKDFQEKMKIEGKCFFKSKAKGYTPTYFMRMCYEIGFKRAIEQCIGTDAYHIPDGFNTLYLADCVDESIEYWLLSEVLSTDGKMHRFMPLFESITYDVAKLRLDNINFDWKIKGIKL
jgi:hypothetical protein